MMDAVTATMLNLRLWAGVPLAKRPLPIEIPRTRAELPWLARRMGATKGAEIGVWRGSFTCQFCERVPRLEMLAVDPWEHYAEWLDGRAKADLEGIYIRTCRRLSRLRCRVIRQRSLDAARDVPDHSLDLVYVDANHTYQSVLDDVIAWVPKVRRGGWIGGHDFKVFPTKPNIHVKEAVMDYTQAHAIAPWFVLTGDLTPSWLWIVQ